MLSQSFHYRQCPDYWTGHTKRKGDDKNLAKCHNVLWVVQIGHQIRGGFANRGILGDDDKHDSHSSCMPGEPQAGSCRNSMPFRQKPCTWPHSMLDLWQRQLQVLHYSPVLLWVEEGTKHFLEGGNSSRPSDKALLAALGVTKACRLNTVLTICKMWWNRWLPTVCGREVPEGWDHMTDAGGTVEKASGEGKDLWEGP